MPTYAQSNIQLYNQLRRAAWADVDLRLVHQAHQLAVRLFAGQLRPNHSLFLAHLVRTASILAAHGATPTIAAAGLLHSAYSHGEFGGGSRGISPQKRRQAERVVGAACEALIAAYATLRWNIADIASVPPGIAACSAADREVAFMRLADLLEDYLDGGMCYAPHKRLPLDAASRNAMHRLAESLGHAALADELRLALDPANDIQPPEFLCGSERGSFLVAPLSHRPRLPVQLLRIYRRARGKLLRAIRGRAPNYSSTPSAPAREVAINSAAPSANSSAATRSPRAAA